MNGDQIREAREARGWTQRDLAKATQTSERTVSNWERGETIPRNRVGMLRQLLGIDTAEQADPLRDATDFALLSELMRRTLERDKQ